jgi:hypothetical protein
MGTGDEVWSTMAIPAHGRGGKVVPKKEAA